MVLYTCQRCNYSTKNKAHYRKHLNRKNPCKIKNIVVTTTPIKCEPIPSPSQFLTIPHKIQYNSKQIYKCKFCNEYLPESIEQDDTRFCAVEKIDFHFNESSS